MMSLKTKADPVAAPPPVCASLAVPKLSELERITLDLDARIARIEGVVKGTDREALLPKVREEQKKVLEVFGLKDQGIPETAIISICGKLALRWLDGDVPPTMLKLDPQSPKPRRLPIDGPARTGQAKSRAVRLQLMDRPLDPNASDFRDRLIRIANELGMMATLNSYWAAVTVAAKDAFRNSGDVFRAVEDKLRALDKKSWVRESDEPSVPVYRKGRP